MPPKPARTSNKKKKGKGNKKKASGRQQDDGADAIVVDLEEKYSKYAHVGDVEELLESVYSAFFESGKRKPCQDYFLINQMVLLVHRVSMWMLVMRSSWTTWLMKSILLKIFGIISWKLFAILPWGG
jgi:hypothetical protein